jgi:uracil-DNA glycosylase
VDDDEVYCKGRAMTFSTAEPGLWNQDGAGDRPRDDANPLYRLPAGWESISAELDKLYFHELARFVAGERERGPVFPPPEEVYAALARTPYERVNVLLLGQDPYHDLGQAHGMCFSVREGVRPPPSLVNIFKELRDDLGVAVPQSGCLTKWADQGVLLLNAVLTVRAHQPNSHKDKGWEKFTDAVIRTVNDRPEPVVFVLWGGYAQKKEKLIDAARHTVIKSAHPSPLSGHNGFFGSRPFSKINEALRAAGKAEVDWAL